MVENYGKIVKTTGWIREELKKIPEVEVIGEPKSAVFAFVLKDKKLLFNVDKKMQEKEWSMAMMTKPNGFRFTVTLANIEKLRSDFIEDLKKSIQFAKEHYDEKVENFHQMLYGTLIKVPNEDFVFQVLGKFFTEINRFKKID